MARRRVLADTTPLRESADFRRLYFGQLISFIGTQLTVVAVPYQVFQLTDSSLQVGLVSLAQLGPLVIGSLVGGAIADSTDRRRVLLWAQVVAAVVTVGLAVNAMLDRPALWVIYVLTSVAAAVSGIERPARSAALPNVVKRESLPAAYALWQILLHVGSVAGPALAGVLISRVGLEAVYWIDVATFGAAMVSVYAMSPLPPHGGGRKAGLGSIVEGLRFLRGKRAIQGTFVIDLNAMIFGLPRAVFPAMAERVFGGGAATYGLLTAAPGAGSLVGALTTGWVGHVKRQGMAVLVSVAVWGGAMVGFGLTSWLWAALLFLAIAGAADVVSAVFRNTILQTSVPDALRGRMSALHIAVVTGGPRLGDAEAGAMAALGGAQFSVVSGGLACLLGVLLVGKLFPEFTRYRVEEEPVASASEPPPVSS